MMENENRYRRQISFGAIGKSGQEKIGASRVLICGCGALGSMIATILARAGVGTLRLLDFDRVEFGNLHRQFLFDEKDAIEKRYKVETAAEKLAAANSSVRIEPFVDRFTRENADFFLDEIDLILDGTDNFPTRFLLNKKRYGEKFLGLRRESSGLRDRF